MQLNYATCGLCLLLYADLDASGSSYGAIYMATGGTVEISAIDTGLVAKLTGGSFAHVNIDPNDYTSTPHPDGCTTSIDEANFVGRLAVACSPLDVNACPAGQGCYAQLPSSGMACEPAGTLPRGAACSTGAECLPGLDCWAGSCLPYCEETNPITCLPTEECVTLGIGVGACQPCPQVLCGGVCCGSGRFCAPTTGSCADAVPCSALTQDCPGGQGCYYDAQQGYRCALAGAGMLGAACAVDADCQPGLGCQSTGWDACTPYCDPSGPASCPASYPTCLSFGDGAGGCQ
ncbi:MAG: hypothetical protein QM765_32845 [Myxococcales bacterium]